NRLAGGAHGCRSREGCECCQFHLFKMSVIQFFGCLCFVERRELVASPGFAPGPPVSETGTLLIMQRGNGRLLAGQNGARGRIRTCTGDALDVVSLLVGLRERKRNGASSRWML